MKMWSLSKKAMKMRRLSKKEGKEGRQAAKTTITQPMHSRPPERKIYTSEDLKWDAP